MKATGIGSEVACMKWLPPGGLLSFRWSIGRPVWAV